MEKHFAENKMNGNESCANNGAALASHSETGECALCKGSKKIANCYACFDMASANADGAVDVFTVEAPCCGNCRKNYNIIKYVPTAAAAAICVITIACLSIRTTLEALASVFFGLPLLVMAVMLGVSLLAAKLIRKMLIKKFSEETHMHILDLSEDYNGLVEINAKHGISNPVFSNEHLSK